MQQSDIHQFTRTEWNSPKKKDLWMDLCKYSKIPAVGYYITPKKSYVYYDTESFGYDLYDAVLLRNDEIVNSLMEGIREVYFRFGVKCIFTESPLRQAILVPKENVEVIANAVYDFLLNFKILLLRGNSFKY